MIRNTVLLMMALVAFPLIMCAQRVEEVNGKYTYTIGDNDHITLREAKHKCIELAKAEAIKKVFGEIVTSDVIDSNAETNGEATSSFFWENTVAMAKGDWLMNTKEPEIEVEYDDGKLTFKAEVWGKVREITPPSTVATSSLVEPHWTGVPSGRTVAVSVAVEPASMDRISSLRVMLYCTGASVTVTSQVAVFSPALAVMVALPALMAVTTPPATVATLSSEEVHVTSVPLGATVAVTVSVEPTCKERVVGATERVMDGVTVGSGLQAARPRRVRPAARNNPTVFFISIN